MKKIDRPVAECQQCFVQARRNKLREFGISTVVKALELFEGGFVQADASIRQSANCIATGLEMIFSDAFANGGIGDPDLSSDIDENARLADIDQPQEKWDGRVSFVGRLLAFRRPEKRLDFLEKLKIQIQWAPGSFNKYRKARFQTIKLLFRQSI